MTDRPREGLFLEQRSYRRRRLHDAARILPVTVALLFVVPLYWADGGGGTRATGVYLFVVWGGAVVAAAVLARVLRRSAGEDG